MNRLVMQSAMHSMEQSSAPTVLVVEDEVMVRMPIAEFLRDCGYEVLEAGDAREAIGLVDDARAHVDVVFSDVRMPGEIDGFGLARWIRRNHPQVPVLLASGYFYPANGREDPSDVPIIPKPYSQLQVERRIERLLRSRVAQNGV